MTLYADRLARIDSNVAFESLLIRMLVAGLVTVLTGGLLIGAHRLLWTTTTTTLFMSLFLLIGMVALITFHPRMRTVLRRKAARKFVELGHPLLVTIPYDVIDQHLHACLQHAGVAPDPDKTVINVQVRVQRLHPTDPLRVDVSVHNHPIPIDPETEAILLLYHSPAGRWGRTFSTRTQWDAQPPTLSAHARLRWHTKMTHPS